MFIHIIFLGFTSTIEGYFNYINFSYFDFVNNIDRITNIYLMM